MKPDVLADTGPLYAAVDPDDEHHHRARKEIHQLQLQGRGIVVAWPVLLEAYTLVLYRLGHRTATRWLDNLLSGADLIHPASEDYREAISRVTRFTDQKITLFDAVTATLAIRMGIEVWTYDHHFDRLKVPVWHP